MSSEEEESSTTCTLCRCVRSGGSTEDVFHTLWNTVWDCMYPGKRIGDTMEHRAHAWVLASCAITGCMNTMCFLLHSLVTQNDKDATTTTQIVNRRTRCDFPLPDSWLHQSVRLALNPLHLACWKLDLHMTQLLLDLGANPNALALETLINSSARQQHKNEGPTGNDVTEIAPNCSNDTEKMCGFSNTTFPVKLEHYQNPEQNTYFNDLEFEEKNLNTPTLAENITASRTVRVDDEMFDLNIGLSPLDFVALGVRCPPAHSMELLRRRGVIHDKGDNFCPQIFESMCSRENCVICQCLVRKHENEIETSYYNVRHSIDEDIEDHMKMKMLTKCIQLLLSAGANPNHGNARCLRFCYPIDLLIQPPIDIYYGPLMGRSTQVAVNVRRHSLASNLPYVTSACHIMITHNAHVSQNFFSLYQWKPQHMDCFAMYPSRHAIDLIKIIALLGLFSDSHCHYPNFPDCYSGQFAERSYNRDIENAKNDKITLHKNLETFITGIVNNESPKELVSIVLQSISVSTIHLFCEIATRIIASSEFEHVYLSAILRRSVKGQMRTLLHSSMVTILNSLTVTHASIQALPIPNLLRKRLLHFDFLGRF